LLASPGLGEGGFFFEQPAFLIGSHQKFVLEVPEPG
jgi:hypothetical protein